MAALRRHARTLRTRFIERRNPPRGLPLRVSRRRVYILPTRNGVVFAVLLLVMLLGATNYSNSPWSADPTSAQSSVLSNFTDLQLQSPRTVDDTPSVLLEPRQHCPSIFG